MSAIRRVYQKCFCDDQGNLTLAQVPNLSGSITIGCIVLGWIFNRGVIHGLAQAGAAMAGVWWAYLEVRYGVNYFRKVLGLFVLILIAKRVAGVLWG